MFSTIKNLFRVKDIRNKILFTLAMLFVFRLGTWISVPGVDTTLISNSQTDFGILNYFGGGALKRFSILAMGVMPYITASIIMQLLQMDVVKKLTEWSKEGEVGRRKIAQVTRYATIILGFIEGLGMSYGFNSQYNLVTNPTVWTFIVIAIVLTAGTAFLMWLGEQITAHGVGNGISMIIFAGIVAAIPSGLNEIYVQLFENAGEKLFINIVYALLILLAVLLIVVAVIFVQQANRKIPIQYAKRVTGGNPSMGGSQNTFLPIKVNAAGVIPVIFAIAMIQTPQMIANFYANLKEPTTMTKWINNHLSLGDPLGLSLYVILIFAFTYFYAFITVNPEKIAENLKKQQGYVPGIRPGIATQEYFSRVLSRLTFVGALFLAVVAALPTLFITFANLPQSAQIGGTSLLIVVGVALDTMKQLEGQLVKRHYKGFIK